MGTFRPEVRDAADDRLDDILVDVYGLDRERVENMPYGVKFERLLDEVQRSQEVR